MINFNPKDIKSILHFAQKLEGKTLREVLTKDSIKKIEQIQNISIEKIYKVTGIDPWFLFYIKKIPLKKNIKKHT